MASVILGATLSLDGGLRLFEDIGLDLIHLERLMVMELPAGRTHLRFRFPWFANKD